MEEGADLGRPALAHQEGERSAFKWLFIRSAQNSDCNFCPRGWRTSRNRAAT